MSEGEAPDLEGLLTQIKSCRACTPEFLHAPRPVVHVTSDVQVLICGQAPGRRVHESGVPFDDASGDRLRTWMGIDRAQFYSDHRVGVAPMAFCYPGTAAGGGDHPPPSRCADLWRKSLLARLPSVELTLLIGGYAQRWALGRRCGGSVSETVGAWRKFLPEVAVLPHPSWRNTAWLARRPWFEAEVVPYLHARIADILAR